MATPKVQPQEVQNTLAGQPVGTVTTDYYRYAVGAREGGVADLAPPGKRLEDRVRPHAQAPNIPPPSVRTFLDRDQELGQIGEALARGHVVDLNGPDGAGKTALISQAMRRQLASQFPEGLVYLHGKYETSGDVLQELFKHFYDTDGKVKVTEDDMRRYMSGKRVLVAVDDLNHLAEREAENVPAALPGCRVLIAGRQQQTWNGVGVTLRGLPREQAVSLFEQNWGRIPPQERPAVEAICQALDDLPLPIVQAATAARTQGLSPAQALDRVRAEGQSPVGKVFGLVAGQLTQQHRRVLGGLAAPGGRTVSVEALAASTRIPAAELARLLQDLQQMGLVFANDSRYSLAEALIPYIRGAWVTEDLQAAAADYYLRLAPRLTVHSQDPDERNVMAALGYYYRLGKWQEVVYIARAVDRYLATSGRWGQWAKRLNQAWQAAKQLGDRATEAWAQNQLGLIAMGLGNYAQAAGLFKAALALWQVLGDKGGMTISQWNLQVLAAAPPPLKGKGGKETAGKASGGSTPTLPWILAAAAVAILVVIGVIFLTPPPTPPPSTEGPPPITVIRPTTAVPTTVVPPELTIELAAGCDEEYTSDATLTILIDSTVNGLVDVSWVDPQGNEEVLFQERVEAGRTARHNWPAPQDRGNWRLEADLNGGAARDRCGFTVAGPEPQVQVWLEEGCNRTYRPGEALTLQALSNVDGRVVVEWRDPSGRSGRLFDEQVVAGEMASQAWSAPDTAGAWTLQAELAGAAAGDDCDFRIEVPEVTIELEDGCNRTYQACQAVTVRLEANVSGEAAVTLIDGEGGRRSQFTERLLAGRTVSRSWDVPRTAGAWTLEVTLDGDVATGLCAFRVDADSVLPVIDESWVEPYVATIYGTPEPSGTVCPGDKVWVYARARDACGDSVARAELNIWDDYDSRWLPAEMQQVDDETWRTIMTAEENPGTTYQIYVEDTYDNSNTLTGQSYGVDSCAAPVTPSVVFYASPDSIEVYKCTMLYWSAENVAGLRYEGQSVALTGSQQECCDYEGTDTYELQVEYLDGSSETFTADVACAGVPVETLDDGVRDLLGEECVTSSYPYYDCPSQVDIWYPDYEPFRKAGTTSIPDSIKSLVDWTEPVTLVVGDGDLYPLLQERIADDLIPPYLVLVYPESTINNLGPLLGEWPQYHRVYYWNQDDNTIYSLQWSAILIP